MREGVAVSKRSGEGIGPTNVVPFPERSVDYTGPAQKLMAGLVKAALQLRGALTDQDKRRLRPEILEMIERIIDTMAVIEEHMDVLDEHSELIKAFIEPGDNVYFSSAGKHIAIEIISLVERRQAMLMVRRLHFKGGSGDLPKLEQDNDRQTLLTHDGCVACKWPRTP